MAGCDWVGSGSETVGDGGHLQPPSCHCGPLERAPEGGQALFGVPIFLCRLFSGKLSLLFIEIHCVKILRFVSRWTEKRVFCGKTFDYGVPIPLGIVGRLEKETDAPRVGAPSTGCTRRLDGYADEVTVRIPVQLRQSNSKESENGRVIQLQQLPDERRCGTAGTPASLCPVSAPHACRSRPARSYSLLGVVSRPSSSGATTSTALQVHPP